MLHSLNITQALRMPGENLNSFKGVEELQKAQKAKIDMTTSLSVTLLYDWQQRICKTIDSAV